MFSHSVERALRAALLAHADQTRKGPDNTPYAVHPAHMALMLERAGFHETVVQAALLHDVVEDCDDWSGERLESEFGPGVASLVAELTEDKTLSWEVRKARIAESIPRMSADAAAIKAVDKLHNLEGLRNSLEEAEDPSAVWRHFKGGCERTLEMDARVVEALEKRVPPRLGEALRQSYEALVVVARRPRSVGTP